MDDEAKELTKIGMEVALRPVTSNAENVLGVAGGDWLSEVRARNRARLKANTEKILHDRNVKATADASPSIVVPLLSAAQEEGREELQDIWARLLAAALDPSRKHLFRREYVEIVRRLEPLDTLVLRQLNTSTNLTPNRLAWIANRLSKAEDEVALAFRNLQKLELIEPPGANNVHVPLPSALGKQFLVTVGQ
ncbi:MAG TPA: Abi-alpha family protein [Rhizomicrobium sp.]|nr:Abi-alpha family protein [Rhizomicrobium sp.]